MVSISAAEAPVGARRDYFGVIITLVVYPTAHNNTSAAMMLSHVDLPYFGLRYRYEGRHDLARWDLCNHRAKGRCCPGKYQSRPGDTGLEVECFPDDSTYSSLLRCCYTVGLLQVF